MFKSFSSKTALSIPAILIIAICLSLFKNPAFAYTTATGSTNTGTQSNTGTQTVTTTTVTTTTTGNPVDAGGSLSSTAGFGVSEDPEFIEALAWMYNNKITGLGTTSTYRPFDKITREESAKILSRFAKSVIGLSYKTEISNEACLFPDSDIISNELANDVFEGCKMGLFRGGSGGFYPKNGLSKAQSIVVLVRMFDNKTYPETIEPWFHNYYERAYELGITKDRDLSNFNSYVTRYEIALMIYRFNIKYKLLKQGNPTTPPQPKIMSILSGSVTTTNGLKKGTAMLDTDVLTNLDTESFPITLFDDAYVVKKRKLDNYGVGNTNFIRFGDIYTANEKTFLGTTSFTVINGSIEEAYLRPTELSNKYYVIKPSNQQPFYTIEEQLAE